MAGIFISYRRADSAAQAGRMYDRLVMHFGRDLVFMDIDVIKPGVDFVEVLESAVSECDALIAVIGTRWLTVTDDAGKRRLDNPNDITRLEVATALDRKIRVIPVLVDGASMPRSEDLPENLAALTRRNALIVSHERFSYDIGKLIEALEEVVALAPGNIPRPVGSRKIQVPAHTRTVEDHQHTIALSLLLVTPLLGALILIFIATRISASNSYVGEWLVPASIISAIVGALGAFGIWKWKKWGAILLILDFVFTCACWTIAIGNFNTNLYSAGHSSVYSGMIFVVLFFVIVAALFGGALRFLLRNQWDLYR